MKRLLVLLTIMVWLVFCASLILAPATAGQGAGTAASIYKSTFANLGTPVDGSVRYCTNCNANTSPCTSGGTGAFAYRVAGAWTCDTATSGGAGSFTTLTTSGTDTFSNNQNATSTWTFQNTDNTSGTSRAQIALTGGLVTVRHLIIAQDAYYFGTLSDNVVHIQQGGANVIDLAAGQASIALLKPTSVTGLLTSTSYATTTNCADSAGAAACGSAAAGAFVIDATTTSTVVSTTAVTANSQIFVQEDSSLGTRLGVTCNTQSSLTLGALRVTARTAATSFTVTIEAGPTTNPMCVTYFIVN